jgi:hypothetical protein
MGERLSNVKLLMLGCIAIAVAGVIGAVISSWASFMWACLILGALIEVFVVVGAQGDSTPRDPEVTAAMMKATQYGKTEAVDMPTGATNWRLLLLGLPVLAVGVATYLILGS